MRLSHYNNSVAASALFTVLPGLSFTSAAFASNGAFQLGFSGLSGSKLCLQATTNLIDWTSILTNQASNNSFNYSIHASNFRLRFYRVLSHSDSTTPIRRPGAARRLRPTPIGQNRIPTPFMGSRRGSKV